jgi:hypothetical protein
VFTKQCCASILHFFEENDIAIKSQFVTLDHDDDATVMMTVGTNKSIETASSDAPIDSNDMEASGYGDDSNGSDTIDNVNGMDEDDEDKMHGLKSNDNTNGSIAIDAAHSQHNVTEPMVCTEDADESIMKECAVWTGSKYDLIL